MEQQYTSDCERQEVDVGMQPAFGVRIVVALFLVGVAVTPVGVVGFAHSLKLQLNRARPEPNASTRTLLDVEQIFVCDVHSTSYGCSPLKYRMPGILEFADQVLGLECVGPSVARSWSFEVRGHETSREEVRLAGRV